MRYFSRSASLKHREKYSSLFVFKKKKKFLSNVRNQALEIGKLEALEIGLGGLGYNARFRCSCRNCWVLPFIPRVTPTWLLQIKIPKIKSIHPQLQVCAAQQAELRFGTIPMLELNHSRWRRPQFLRPTDKTTLPHGP